MKPAPHLVVSLCLLAGSTAAFAAYPGSTSCNDSSLQRPAAHVTRQQVRQELIDLEAAGYDPFKVGAYYPRGIQAAERRVDAEYAHNCQPGETAGQAG